MSEENVEVFRRMVEALNRGDGEGAIKIADPPPEFEFVPSGVLIPDLASVQRGPEGFRRINEWFWGEFDDPRIKVHELIDAGDQVFTSFTLSGRGDWCADWRAADSAGPRTAARSQLAPMPIACTTSEPMAGSPLVYEVCASGAPVSAE